MPIATAEELLAAALADINHLPKLLYGLRSLNGLPQRGPNSYDCIGWVRKILLQEAPTLWPTAWGGPDSWTVPNFLDAWRSDGKPVNAAPAKPADLLVWIDSQGTPAHIGFADGLGNVLSSFNPEFGICSLPITSVGYPTLLVLATRLIQPEKTVVPPNNPISVFRVGIDANIRAIVHGTDTLRQISLGGDFICYSTVVRAGLIPGDAHVTQDDDSGEMLDVLDRNITLIFPMNVGTNNVDVPGAIGDLNDAITKLQGG